MKQITKWSSLHSLGGELLARTTSDRMPPPRHRMLGGDTPLGGSPATIGHAGRARLRDAWHCLVVFFVTNVVLLFGQFLGMPGPLRMATALAETHQIETTGQRFTVTVVLDSDDIAGSFNEASWYTDEQGTTYKCVDPFTLFSAGTFAESNILDKFSLESVNHCGLAAFWCSQNVEEDKIGIVTQIFIWKMLYADGYFPGHHVKDWVIEDYDVNAALARFESWYQANRGRYTGHGTYWTNGDTQAVAHFWAEERLGTAQLSKSSTLSGVTQNNARYSLADAQYELFRDSACTQSLGAAYNLVTNAEGVTNTVELEAGNYWLRESVAPQGYLLDSQVHAFTVTAGKKTTVQVSDQPLYERPSLWVSKQDSDLGSAQGAGTLAGAEFTVRYYDGLYATPQSLPSQPKRTWIMRTDQNGQVIPAASNKVEGDEFFLDSEGKVVLPIGTVTIQETRAPAGYWLEGQPESASDAPLHMVGVSGAGSFVAPTVLDQVRRAGISLQKADTQTGTTPQGDATLADTRFRIINRNSQSVVVGGKTYEPGAAIDMSLITNGRGEASTDSSLLPLGTYEVQEVSTNESMRLIAPSQQITLTHENTQKVVALDTAFGNEVVRGGVKIHKVDVELGRGEAQGDASLENVSFAITTNSEHPVVINGTTFTKGQVVCTIRTNKQGVAQTEAHSLPYGTYTIREASAPIGYLRDTSYQASFQIRQDGAMVDLSASPCADQVIRGGVRLGKIDAERQAATAQGDATLKEAAFAITLDSKQPVLVDGQMHSQGDVVKIIRTNAEGRAQTGSLDLPYGTYSIREHAAPTGYVLNSEFKRQFSIRENGTVVNLGDTACRDQVIRGDVMVGKVSRETSQHLPQGEARLDGAKLAIRLDSTQPVYVGGTLFERGQTVCTIITNEEGIARTEGKALPFGTYTVTEIEPPLGFLPNTDWSLQFSIREDGATYDYSSERQSVADQVKRGGFYLNKVDEATMERMGNTVFRITSKTTGESHVLVADENGILSTEVEDHTLRTNANDDALDEEGRLHEERLVSDAGIWFSGSTKTSVTPRDDMGALPYDSYLVEELSSTANEGRTPVSFVIRIHKHDTYLDMGTVDNKTDEKPEPWLGTTLTYGGRLHVAPVAKQVSLVDTVSYANLTVGENYTLEGRLVRKSDGKAVCDEKGNEVTASTTLTPRVPTGSVDVVFSLDSTSLAGDAVVAYETITCPDGRTIQHEDLNDSSQTVGFPTVGTTLADEEGNHEIRADETIRLVDHVAYDGLAPGMAYEITGTLYDKQTEEVLCTDSGMEVHGQCTFVPEESQGTAVVTFTFPGSCAAGKTLVATEALRWNGVIMAQHDDLTDVAQTVTIPTIRTQLTDEQGHKELTSEGTIELVDAVSYAGLQPDVTYVLEGTIMDKATGEALCDDEGNTITSSTTLTPSDDHGCAYVTFTLDAALARGRTIVAFETLKRDERELVVHADLEDEAQTAFVPAIGTIMTDVNGAHESAALAETSFADLIAYEGLRPGVPYTMAGTLIDAATGKPATNDQDEAICAKTEFVPEASSGTAEVVFAFDATRFAGTSLVAFEALHEGTSDDARVIARHEDASNKDQTIALPRISTTATDAEDSDKVVAEGTIRICDTVHYSNLTPGVTYTMRGTLYSKKTNTPLINEDGSPVANAVEFVPSKSAGDVVLEFETDSSLVEGDAIVVFESCLRNDIEVASHADIEDEDQTVTIERQEPQEPEMPTEGTPQEDTPSKQDTPQLDVPKQDAPKKDTPKQDVPEKVAKAPRTGDELPQVGKLFAVALAFLIVARVLATKLRL